MRKSYLPCLEVSRRLVFSTAHMPQEENKSMRKKCAAADPRFEELWASYASSEFGDVFTLPYTDVKRNLDLIRVLAPEFPHLAILLSMGVLEGVDEVCIDGDGSVVSYLKTYDW